MIKDGETSEKNICNIYNRWNTKFGLYKVYEVKNDVFSFYNYTQLAPQPSLLTTAEKKKKTIKKQKKLHTINQIYLNKKQKKPKTKTKIFLQSNLVVFNIFILKTQTGGPVAKILCLQCRGAQVQFLVGELDPTCPN